MPSGISSPKAISGVTSVGFLLVPDFALMSYTTAIEPLRAANLIAGNTLYQWRHVTPNNAHAAASNGVTIVPDADIDADASDLDILFVCAGGNPSTFKNRQVLAWLRRLARHGVTIGGISGGPFILARAGLLANRRCTIHWEHMAAFQESFPDIRLTKSLFIFDEDRITCSGGLASFDMMIALIARDHGSELAGAVSDWFLHTHIREGVEPQRMDLRFRLGISNKVLLKVLDIMEGELDTPHSRETLAAMSGVSVRQLERLFHRHLGRGIHQHYLSLRLTRARQLLRESSLSVSAISASTGFSSASQFARAFRKNYGVSPRHLMRMS